MPSAYTAPIIDGEITTAQDFARVCARAFMFNMRDTAFDAPLFAPERDEFYTKSLHEAIKELAEWDSMGEEDKYAAWSDIADKVEQRRREARARTDKSAMYLHSVLESVNSIDVPESLAEFKQFMIDQLNETFEFDGTFKPQYYTVPDYCAWVETQRELILDRIQRYAKEAKEAEQRYQQGREWLHDLADTFGLEIKGL